MLGEFLSNNYYYLWVNSDDTLKCATKINSGNNWSFDVCRYPISHRFQQQQQQQSYNATAVIKLFIFFFCSYCLFQSSGFWFICFCNSSSKLSSMFEENISHQCIKMVYHYRYKMITYLLKLLLTSNYHFLTALLFFILDKN